MAEAKLEINELVYHPPANKMTVSALIEVDKNNKARDLIMFYGKMRGVGWVKALENEEYEENGTVVMSVMLENSRPLGEYEISTKGCDSFSWNVADLGGITCNVHPKGQCEFTGLGNAFKLDCP